MIKTVKRNTVRIWARTAGQRWFLIRLASSGTKAVAKDEITVDGMVSSGRVMPLMMPKCAIAALFSQPAATKRSGNNIVTMGIVKLANKRTPVIGVAALRIGFSHGCG